MEKTQFHRNLVTVVLAFILVWSFIGTFHSTDYSQTIMHDNVAPDLVEKYQTSALETSWFHDCSNVTGWENYSSSVDLPLNSIGSNLFRWPYFATSNTTTDYSSYIYNLETPIVVGNHLKLKVHFDNMIMTTQLGDAAVILLDENYDQVCKIMYRDDYFDTGDISLITAVSEGEGSFAADEWQSNLWQPIVRLEYEGYVENLEYWSNNLEFGLMTADYDNSQRIINHVLVFFSCPNNGYEYADIRIDWIELTGGSMTTIDSPTDIEMDYTEIGNNVTWHPEAYYPEEYELRINNVLQENDTWDGSDLSFSLNGLGCGEYVYNLTVIDELGFRLSDNVTITVTDSVDPTVEDVQDRMLEYGTSGQNITWECNDLYPDSFNITLDDSLLISDSWDGGDLSIPLDGLDIGLHNYEITVNDTSGNFAQDTVTVNVVDTSSPIIITPGSIQMYEGETGRSIIWTVSDAHPSTYEIYIDEALETSDSWSSSISISLNGLEFGVHEYFLIVYDEFMNSANSTVEVNVVDVTNPTVVPLDDLAIELGTLGEALIWSCDDFHPDSYLIIVNAIEMESGIWNGSDISYLLNGLDLGNHVLILTVYDTTGLNATDEVNVLVSDTTAPTINHPEDITFVSGSIWNIITWETHDLKPQTFQYYLNGTGLGETVWTVFGIHLIVDNLDVGIHNITLLITDSTGNTASDSVIVTILSSETSSTTTETTSTTTETNSTTNTGSTNETPDGTMTILTIAGAGGLVSIIVISIIKKKS